MNKIMICRLLVVMLFTALSKVVCMQPGVSIITPNDIQQKVAACEHQFKDSLNDSRRLREMMKILGQLDEQLRKVVCKDARQRAVLQESINRIANTINGNIRELEKNKNPGPRTLNAIEQELFELQKQCSFVKDSLEVLRGIWQRLNGIRTELLGYTEVRQSKKRIELEAVCKQLLDPVTETLKKLDAPHFQPCPITSGLHHN